MKRSFILFLAIILLVVIGSSVQAAEFTGKNLLFINAEKHEGPNYKDIQINKSNGAYVVTGHAKVRKGVFYYMVENGHNVIVPEKKVKVHNLSWTSFKLKISIPAEKIPKNGALILYLYEKDKSGNVKNQHPIVLDKFNG